MQGLGNPNPKQLPDFSKREAESACLCLLTCFAPGALLPIAWAAESEAGMQCLQEAQLSLGTPGAGCSRDLRRCTLGPMGLTPGRC